MKRYISKLLYTLQSRKFILFCVSTYMLINNYIDGYQWLISAALYVMPKEAIKFMENFKK